MQADNIDTSKELSNLKTMSCDHLNKGGETQIKAVFLSLIVIKVSINRAMNSAYHKRV